MAETLPSLSDILRSMQVRHADFALLRFGSDVGLELLNSRTVHFHLVLAGEMQFTFADLDQPLAVAVGGYIFVPQGLRHRIGLATASNFIELNHFRDPRHDDRPVALFPESNVGERTSKAVLLSGAVDIDSARHETLVRLVPEIRSYRRRKGVTVFDAADLINLPGILNLADESGSSAILRAQVEALLARATQMSLRSGGAPSAGIATPDAPQIAIALRMLHERPEQHWSVGSLAREAGMSRTVFAASFHARVGQTPMSYLTEVRMQRGEELLREGRRLLSEIAHLCGYDSGTAFARAFTRRFGMSPGRYRRHQPAP